MNRAAPSRRLLRELALICKESRLVPRPNASMRSICTRSPLPVKSSRASLYSSPICQCRHQSTSQQADIDSDTADMPPSPSLPDITTHYTLFPRTLPRGPPPNGPFTIPLPALRREFLSLQSQFHPDKASASASAAAAPAESSLSLSGNNLAALSSVINTAYRTLSDPLLRGQYLLRLLYEVDVMSEDNSAHPTDSETLMDVMDAQERIEECQTQHDIGVLVDENAKRVKETVERMGEAFERGDAEEAKRECVRLKYWASLGEGLREWEPGKEVRLVQ